MKLLGKLLLAGFVVSTVIVGRDLAFRPAPTEAVFANIVTVADGEMGAGRYSSLELRGGNPVISYQYRPASDGDLRLLECDNPYCTGTHAPVPIETIGDVGFYSSLDLDSGHHALVSHYRPGNTDHKLGIVHCTSDDCATWDYGSTTSTVQDVGAFSSIQLFGGNTLGVAFQNASTGQPNYMYCSTLNCSAAPGPVTLDASATDGSSTALAFGNTGEGVVAYANDGHLRVATCLTYACAGAAHAEPDSESNPVIQYISIVIDASSGNPVLSYYDGSDLKIMHCNDGRCDPTPGSPGNGPETISRPDTEGNVGRYTSLALDSAGYPVVSYYDATSGDLKILHCNDANCAGGGESITSPDTDGDVGQFTSLKLDAAGNPVVSYFDNTNEHLKVLHCGNPKCKGAVTQVSPAVVGPDPSGFDFDIELDSNGNPVVAYYDAVTQDLKLLHCHSAACTGGITTTTIDSTGDVGDQLSMVLDGSDNPLIAYRDATNLDLKFVRCNDPNCVGDTGTTRESAGNVGADVDLALSGNLPVIVYRRVISPGDEYLRIMRCNVDCSSSLGTLDLLHGSPGGYSLQIDNSGQPVVAYWDVFLGDMGVLRCTNLCSGPQAPPETVDGAGAYLGFPPSMQLDGDNPVLSYFDGGPPDHDDLKVAHCGDPACDDAVLPVERITRPDSIGYVGENSSLRLDPAGNPVISYYDRTNGDLKLLHCGDPACAANNTFASPDTVGSVGNYTSLVLDIEGNPVVAYFDSTNQTLKVLRCGNPTCRSGNAVATISDSSDFGKYSSLELDPAGNPVVAYIDAANTQLVVMHCNDPACAGNNEHFERPASLSWNEVTGQIPFSLELGRTGNPLIAYSTGFDIRLLTCGDVNCTVGNSDNPVQQLGAPNLASPSLGIDDYLSAIDEPAIAYSDFTPATKALKVAYCDAPDENCSPPPSLQTLSYTAEHPHLAVREGHFDWPTVAYARAVDLQLEVFTCSDPVCAVRSGPYTVASSSEVARGYISSMVLDAQDHPIIAIDGPRVIHCNDIACDGSNEVISALRSGGRKPSMAIDPGSGNPVLSYQDETQTDPDLVLLRCGDPNCTSGNVVTRVDTGGVGSYSSLKLDTLGNPVISYYDEAHHKLKIVHCDNPTCTGGKFSTPIGPGVDAVLGNGVTVTFENVTGPGTTTLQTTNSGPPAPAGFKFGCDTCGTPIFYEIATTADFNPATGPNAPIRICINFEQASIPMGMRDSIQLFHYEDGDWQYLPPYVTNVVRDGNGVCGTVTSLSPFALGTRDPGNNFVRADISTAATSGQWTSLALDAQGEPVVAYYQSSPGYDLKVQHCDDPNCAGGHDAVVSADMAGDVGTWKSLAIDAAGNPVVSYRDNTNNRLKILHCDDPTCAGGGESISTIVANAYENSLVLDFAGNPVVAYNDVGGSRLAVLHCDDPNCSGSGESITGPDSAGDVGYYPSLALDGYGNPVVSYYDFTNGDLKLLHCDDPNCSGTGESITTPFSAGDEGLYTSLALDSSGNPVVSFCSGVDIVHCEDLFVLHCTDANCAPGGDLLIDVDSTVAQVGEFSSLELDLAGNPVVSYYDRTNGNLKIIHCDDIYCVAGGNSIVAADTVGDVGSYSSLALDFGGMPVISYFDQTNTDLKLLHCSDPNCALGPNVNADMDGDGCPTTKEQQSAMNSQNSGGLRDAQNPWDYFNPSHDGKNRVDDILMVVAQYHLDDTDGNPGLPPYTLYASTLNGAIDAVATTINVVSTAGARGADVIQVDAERIKYTGKTASSFTGATRGFDGTVAASHLDSAAVGGPSYNADTDRTLVGPNAWNLGPPNGQQRVDDILNAVHQYHHDCS